jgi:hypothetical protein
MKHVIVGNGNLGNSIATELLKRGHDIKIFSVSNGWRYPTSLQSIYDEIPDHVWVTVGAGSVEQAKANFIPFVDLHIKLPMELAQNLHSSTTLHTFSTDYVVEKEANMSLYAVSKDTMEQALFLLQRPKTFIYRIGSLYGTHKPQKCFPYKLKKNSLKNEISLPANQITPTPTDWLAKIILDNLNDIDYAKTTLYNVAPLDSTPVYGWGSLILECIIKHAGVDSSRPLISKIQCNLPVKENVTWLDLWKERESEWREILNKIIV